MTLTVEKPKRKVGPLRRGEGKATAFKTTGPVLLVINAIATQDAQLACHIAYRAAGRMNAVLHLEHSDIVAQHVVFRKEFAKTNKNHEVKQARTLRDVLASEPVEEYLAALKARGCEQLFPAKRRAKAKPTNVYKFSRDPVTGNSVRTKVGEKFRNVLTLTTLDYHINKALKLIVADDSGYYSRLIQQNQDGEYDELLNALEQSNGSFSEAIAGIYKGFSSHSFRRSMAKYLYYTQEWKATKCMTLTGHKSIGAFSLYVEEDKNEVDNDMDEI